MTLHPALVRSRTGVLVADGLGGLVLFIASGGLRAALGSADAGVGTGSLVVFVFAAAVMAAAMTVRRLRPEWALGLAWVSTVVHMLGGLDAELTQLGVLIVLATAAHYGSTLVLRVSGASVVVGAIIAVVYLVAIDSWIVRVFGGTAFTPSWVPYAVLVVLIGMVLAVPWLIGLLARYLRLSREGRERAALAQAEARRAREIADLQASRMSLARDVHDIVGHSLAVIIAQAESVRFRDVAEPDDLEAVRTTVATIADTARRSLGEVRQVLASTSLESTSTDSTIESPQPTSSLDLDRLIGDVERSRPGMIVRRADTVRLPSGEASVALYRAVQELLTNALRHGDSAEPLIVDIAETSDHIEVEVVNSVAGAGDSEHPAARHGTGIDGARSRLEAVAGSLTIDASTHTFRAIARVPVGEGDS
ncbi:MAG: hypothetical protein KIT89_04235 [Microcella sp.]|uniref:sensor histidine kinase n=1 Tax=Microcella sp. TaxID=1913979 RepID=UPI0024CAD7F0|nr:histidine kinase [Microcella sp.]UYN84406.1 MAG: hypothetical protein KIT89_04235 [Microcella sp.]